MLFFFKFLFQIAVDSTGACNKQFSVDHEHPSLKLTFLSYSSQCVLVDLVGMLHPFSNSKAGYVFTCANERS